MTPNRSRHSSESARKASKDKIGIGSFGKVYKVTEPNGKTYCIKTIRGQEKDKAGVLSKEINILKNEISILRSIRGRGNISSDFIVTLLHSELSGRQPVLHIEFCALGDLKSLIDKQKLLNTPFAETLVWSVLSQIATALCGLHYNLKVPPEELKNVFRNIRSRRSANTIMHRDIKPANILLTSAFSAINNYKGVKVADFGLAEQSKRAVTLSGSWRYVAPEILQCDGKGYDRKVDIWSLGCTMYELCERKCLFPEKGEALKNAILGAKKAPQVRSYSAELNFLLKQCLQYDSVDRCSSLDLLNSLGVRFWHYSNDQSENLNAKAIEVRIKQEIQTAQIDKLNRELHEQRTELQKIYDLQADIKRIRDELKRLSHIK